MDDVGTASLSADFWVDCGFGAYTNIELDVTDMVVLMNGSSLLFRLILMLGLSLLLACGPKKTRLTFYQKNTQASHASTGKKGPPRVIVLNSNVVSEFPRTSFEKYFGKEDDFTEALSEAFQTVYSGVQEVHLLKDRPDIMTVKVAVRDYFGLEKDPRVADEPMALPGSLGEVAAPYWLITDWAYLVQSHVEYGGAHQIPGGVSMGIHHYGYYHIVLYGLAVDETGHVTRYASAKVKAKYILNAKKLPLDKLLRQAVKNFGQLISDPKPADELVGRPKNFFHR